MFRSSGWVTGWLLLAVAFSVTGCSNSGLPISVAISPKSSVAIDQSQTLPLSATVTNDRGDKGVTWSIAGIGSLSGVSETAVTYSSPTSVLSVAQQVTITATSVADATKSASIEITVDPYLEIPALQTLPSGQAGTPYNETIELTGGTAPFQWGLYNGPIDSGWRVNGNLPDGLQLDPSTGTISGTPTGAGTWYFEATVTDAAGASTVDGFLSIQINPVSSAANPVPLLNQPVTPTAVAPGSPSFNLSLSGTGFVPGATVSFNRQSLPTSLINSAQLIVTVPAAAVANSGTAAVSVVNPGPGGGESNTVYLQIGSPEAAVSFENAQNSPIAIYLPAGLAVADFNEDGKPDLAVIANVRAYILLGNGDGTFGAAPGSPLPLPSPPYDDFGSPYASGITTGDFNHSGHTGLAITLLQNSAVDTLFGNGDGTFTYSGTSAYTSGEPTTGLAAGDFNADGNLDLFAMNNGSGVSPVGLLGYAHGAFNAVIQNFQLGDAGWAAAGDFNRDGKLDIAMDGVSILLGNGDGTFTQGLAAPAGSAPEGFTVGDFNGDGKLDMAVCNYDSGTVTVLLGKGDGTFTVAPDSPVAVGNNPDAIVEGDFNDDGKLDLAVANYGDGTVTLLLGNGDGTFAESADSPYAVGKGPYQIVAADFNGDGKLDLAVANVTDGTVSILLQH